MYGRSVVTHNVLLHVTDVKRAVDLCAAPGSWSQVLQRRLGTAAQDVRIVSVDIQPMAALEGVRQLQADITRLDTARDIVLELGGERADLVVCDGAPDVTGLHDMDIYIQGRLLLSALHIAQHVLRAHGTFVAKMFRGKDVWLLTSQLEQLFRDVVVTKPPSSRNSSIESFVVCRGYEPPAGLEAGEAAAYLAAWPASDPNQLHGVNRRLVPFAVCGDLSGWDADTTFPLNAAHRWRPPVQPPLAPPYKTAAAQQHLLDSSLASLNLDLDLDLNMDLNLRLDLNEPHHHC